MDLQIDCTKVEISPNSGRYITVSLDNVSVSDVLNHFSISDILENFSEGDLLEKIGQDKVESYFELVPK